MSSLFRASLMAYFNTDTMYGVCDVLKQLDLPEPEDEYLTGTDGILIFMERYGSVLRIEHTQNTNEMAMYTERKIERIKHAHILQPLFSCEVGNVTIEICPGTKAAKDEATVDEVYYKLKKSNISYWDNQISNTGILPIKTLEFPKGIPVVIDRLAVEKMPSYGLIKDVLSEHHAEKINEFYQPLKDIFHDAIAKDGLPDKTKINKAWQLCEQFKAEDKLITGWNEDTCEKAEIASSVAKAYDKKLNKHISKGCAI